MMDMQAIPRTLSPFFQEYDFARLNVETAAHTIIERALQFGNRAELRWLFAAYSQAQITDWVRHFGEDRLPQPHRTFWQIVLETNE
jgi:hypothetical protein